MSAFRCDSGPWSRCMRAMPMASDNKVAKSSSSTACGTTSSGAALRWLSRIDARSASATVGGTVVDRRHVEARFHEGVPAPWRLGEVARLRRDVALEAGPRHAIPGLLGRLARLRCLGGRVPRRPDPRGRAPGVLDRPRARRDRPVWQAVGVARRHAEGLVARHPAAAGARTPPRLQPRRGRAGRLLRPGASGDGFGGTRRWPAPCPPYVTRSGRL